MGIHTTRWSPDTCDCVIEYTWDDTENEDTRTHNYSKAVVKCTVHATTLPTNHFESVLAENIAKNKMRNWLIDNIPTSRKTLPDGGLDLSDSISFIPSFVGPGPVRALNVRVTGINLTATQKNNWRSFGAGLGLPNVTVI